MKADELTLVPVTEKDIEELRSISIATFEASFAPYNTPHNMQQYISEYLCHSKLLEEVNNPNLIFILCA